MIRSYLQTVIDDTNTIAGKIFDWFIQAVILLSIASYTIETLPELSESAIKTLDILETSCVAVFSIELLLRLFFSRKGFRYLFSFFGVIDVVAILPFYLAMGVDLRSVRAFRLFRMLRLLKLARYSKAMRRYHIAFKSAREEIILFGATALIIIFLAAVGINYFESEAQSDKFGSIPDCLWWAVTTLTTVGYGDSFPITAGGKVFTFVILAVGLAIVAVPSGIMASALSQAREELKETAKGDDPKK